MRIRLAPLGLIYEDDDPLIKELRLPAVDVVNDRLAPYDKAAVQHGLRAFVPELEVIDLLHHDWVADPYAQGTWCGLRPGQTSQYLLQAQRPEGRLVFAGADIGPARRSSPMS